MIRLVAIATFAMCACGGGTTIEQSWTAPTARNQPPLRKVVTLFISNDVTTRRAGEDKLARDLNARGVQATPAYTILGDQELSNLDTVKAKLRSMGYDGIVAMRIVNREHQLEYMPPTFDGYWGYAYSGFYSPGYAYTETIVRIETTAYSLRNNQLVWSALTKTVDPGSARSLVNDTSKVVASQLTQRGLAG
jgi:hypothetical protein